MSACYDELEAQIDHVMQKKELTAEECMMLCQRMRSLLEDEANCVQVACPVVVVGDLHGQFEDFKELLQTSGAPPETNYLFLGDYVDRGKFSVKTVTLAFLLKARYRDRVCLLRGNHESRQITQVYGFYDECLRTYGCPVVWKSFTDAFDLLPLTALIQGKVFCPHGGLSPFLSTIDDVQQLDRFQEVPHEGPMCDLMWSDPVEVEGWHVSSRGAGYEFGPDVSEQFIHQNGLRLIVRAHQLVMDGFSWSHNRTVATIFSAPNYCRARNSAAVIEFDEHMNCEIKQFGAAPACRVSLEHADRQQLARKFPDSFLSRPSHSAYSPAADAIKSAL
jgi:serine/threonine-protein phosphatase 2A catalytic subunit